MAKKMTIALYTGSFDKLTATGVIINGAVADDLDVEIYVLLMGANAFKKENIGKTDHMAELTDKKDEFLASLKQLKVFTWMEFFKQAKEMGNVKIYICGLAGKIWNGLVLEDFNELADDICGIGEYIASAQTADVNLFI
jgi:peroxiredoxin family protein